MHAGINIDASTACQQHYVIYVHTLNTYVRTLNTDIILCKVRSNLGFVLCTCFNEDLVYRDLLDNFQALSSFQRTRQEKEHRRCTAIVRNNLPAIYSDVETKIHNAYSFS